MYMITFIYRYLYLDDHSGNGQATEGEAGLRCIACIKSKNQLLIRIVSIHTRCLHQGRYSIGHPNSQK